MFRLGLIVLSLGIFSIPCLAADKGKANKARPAVAELLKGSADDFIKRFDRNKDGYLSKNELPPRMANGFDRWDANADGKLNKEEVEQMLQMLRRRLGVGSKDKPKSADVDRVVARLLGRMDTNKDGKLSRDEAKGPIAQNFDRLDANKDGFLDKEELRVAAKRFVEANGGKKPAVGGRPRKNNDGPANVGQAAPNFDALDQNADGRLTREELKGTALADKFAEIDTNKDGKIDRKEFDAYFVRRANSGRADSNR